MNRNLASGPVPAYRANQARVSPALEDRQAARELFQVDDMGFVWCCSSKEEKG
ncbi:MAG: hypothetical protein AB8I69_14735 [Anaerolineae bacterium]